MRDYNQQIETQFKHYVVDKDAINKMYQIRIACANLAELINKLVPDSLEKSKAIADLNVVMFWANAGIARYTTHKVTQWDKFFTKMSNNELISEYEKSNESLQDESRSDFLLAEMARRFYIKNEN